jgi:hypothetical protein
MSKPRTPSIRPPLLCEICARDPAHADSLSAIAVICAHDVGQKLVFKTLPPGNGGQGKPAPSSLTLHLPAELAATQHPVWCLGCRLACFLPDVRISVLIQGAQAFAAPQRARRRRAA